MLSEVQKQGLLMSLCTVWTDSSPGMPIDYNITDKSLPIWLSSKYAAICTNSAVLPTAFSCVVV